MYRGRKEIDTYKVAQAVDQISGNTSPRGEMVIQILIVDEFKDFIKLENQDHHGFNDSDWEKLLEEREKLIAEISRVVDRRCGKMPLHTEFAAALLYDQLKRPW